MLNVPVSLNCSSMLIGLVPCVKSISSLNICMLLFSPAMVLALRLIMLPISIVMLLSVPFNVKLMRLAALFIVRVTLSAIPVVKFCVAELLQLYTCVPAGSVMFSSFGTAVPFRNSNAVTSVVFALHDAFVSVGYVTVVPGVRFILTFGVSCCTV